MSDTRTWYHRHYGEFDKPFIAYFSMEYGLTECLRNLFRRPGHTFRRSSQERVRSGVCRWLGIGLLYEEGYFHQYLNADGYQQQSYPINDYPNLPVKQVYGDDGKPLIIEVKDRNAQCQGAGVAGAGGAGDAVSAGHDLPDNAEEIRDLTDRLYGGDKRIRIRQEILLGIGGIRLLEKLKNSPVRLPHERRPQRIPGAGARPRLLEEPRLTFWRSSGYLRRQQHLHHPHAGSRRPGTVWVRSDR